MNEELNLTTIEEIQNLIYTIRGKHVMIDSDVANLYHAETRAINQALKRNIDRFPEEFCFQLTDEEFLNLRSQIVIFKSKTNNGKVTRKYNNKSKCKNSRSICKNETLFKGQWSII